MTVRNATTSLSGRRNTFLLPEVRNDYAISAQMKAVWKVELDILECILQICKKHDLRITLHAGSLLGAIRHKGFVPWDDDLDVLMPRADYDVFLKVAPDELPSRYFMKTQYNDRGYLSPFAKIVDMTTSAIESEYSDYGIISRLGIFVDVFPFDALPDDDRERRSLFRSAVHYQSVRRRLVVRKRDGLSDTIKWLIANAEMMCRGGWGRSSRRMEDYCRSRCQWEGATMGCACPLWLRTDNYRRWSYPLHIFDKIELAQFEYLQAPISSFWEEMLVISYGDWRKMVRGGTLHEGMAFDPQKNFIDTLVESYGYSASDFPKDWRVES